MANLMDHGRRQQAQALFAGILLLPLACLVCGCTSLPEYIHNGFKVGPNYKKPPAAVAPDWIDATELPPRKDDGDLSKWWTVFNDPVLDQLICFAYKQNLTLREAGFRILQARAQLGIAVGNFFPQTQQLEGDRLRKAVSIETANTGFARQRFFSQTDFGFNLAWELDFWGKFRRAIESARATLDASVYDYDDVLVTLLSDVATNYVQLRTTEERLRYARENVDIQRKTLKIAEARYKAGTVRELDVDQAFTLLLQTEAGIPELEIVLRQFNNHLCILLGIPPEELRAKLGPAPIPKAPAEVALGIPADLLRRRPDVRRAERHAAAQSAQIGYAEADLYPHITLTGFVQVSALQFKDIFRPEALNGTFGPSFQWNVLNYGRLLNNVRLQDYRFKELVAVYQQSVLTGNQEAENGIITFLKAQQRARLQGESVKYAEKAVKVVLAQYDSGLVDFTRVTQLEQILVQEQDLLAQAQGEIALGLIQIYKAMGGGWELRQTGCDPQAETCSPGATAHDAAVPSEAVPTVPPQAELRSSRPEARVRASMQARDNQVER